MLLKGVSKTNTIKFSGWGLKDTSGCGARGSGFPIIDSAMRYFNQTGWMHNRSCSRNLRC